MVSGFGRFVRADENSRNMSDLRAYRCRIAVDDVREIPHRLSIVLGEECYDIIVHLESSERIRAGGDDQPPPQAPNGPNDGGPGSDVLGGRREERRGEAGEAGDDVGDGEETTALDRGSEISVNRRSMWSGGGGDRILAAPGGSVDQGREAPSADSGATGEAHRGAAGGRGGWRPVSRRFGGDGWRAHTSREPGGAPKSRGGLPKPLGTRARAWIQARGGTGKERGDARSVADVGGGVFRIGCRGGTLVRRESEAVGVGEASKGKEVRVVFEEAQMVIMKRVLGSCGGIGGSCPKTWSGDGDVCVGGVLDGIKIGAINEGGVGAACGAFNAWGCLVLVKGCWVNLVWGCGVGGTLIWGGSFGASYAQIRRGLGSVDPRGLVGEPNRGGVVGEPCGVDLGAEGKGMQNYDWRKRLTAGVEEEVEGEPAAESGWPVEGARGIRHSRRLAALDDTPIAVKAIARRALRENYGGHGGGRRSIKSRRKIQARSASCGVVLNDGETNSFMEFVSHKG